MDFPQPGYPRVCAPVLGAWFSIPTVGRVQRSVHRWAD